MSKGRLFIISGASGAGKGTVLEKLFETSDNLFYSVSATTRGPRPGETDGADYYFKTRDEFERMIENGEFLEYAQYAGNYYGTPAAPVRSRIENGQNVILEIDLQGCLQVKEKMPDAVSVFIAPPSFEELERRLRGRGTETEEKIRERLETAKKELEAAAIYDYTVINDDVESAARRLRSIMSV